jgi:uncharacterized RDD family membrane protein YckC
MSAPAIHEPLVPPSNPLDPLADRLYVIKTLVPPEGVPIRFQVASLSERFWSFAIDLALIGAMLTGLAMASALVLRGVSEQLAGVIAALFFLGSFLLVNFYFTFLEIRWHGRTVGKRWLRLRVIDAAGAPLKADAIIARNLMRDVEWILPVVVLLQPQILWPGAPAYAAFAGAGWLFVVLLLPAFNREHRRAGDLVGGTLVVRQPRAPLLVDLAAQPPHARDPAARFAFTDRQLSIYGITELQVLENLLRAPRPAAGAISLVCAKITARIGWHGEVPRNQHLVFLREFYRAQRSHLEHRLLLGRRKLSKRDPGDHSNTAPSSASRPPSR